MFAHIFYRENIKHSLYVQRNRYRRYHMNKINVSIDVYGDNLKEMLDSIRQALKDVEVALDRREAEGELFVSGFCSHRVNEHTSLNISYKKLQ
jgi:hypothetical protein